VKQTKKKSIFDGKGIFITLVVITSLLVITVVMNLVLPEETPDESVEQTAWQQTAAQSAKVYDDGLTSVYTQEAVAVSSTQPPETAAPTPTEQPKATLLLPVSGGISKDFSAEELVFSETMQDWRVHEGIDLAAEEGAEVIAAADGVVELAGDDGMMGVCVLLQHPDGTKTYYANLKEEGLPEVGAEIYAGQVIGQVGKTAGAEIAEPSHLHFELRKGEERLNPHDHLADTVTDDE